MNEINIITKINDEEIHQILKIKMIIQTYLNT